MRALSKINFMKELDTEPIPKEYQGICSYTKFGTWLYKNDVQEFNRLYQEYHNQFNLNEVEKLFLQDNLRHKVYK